MKVNIEIDDKLIAKAQQISGIKDINILVEKALQLYVNTQSQERIKELKGRIKQ